LPTLIAPFERARFLIMEPPVSASSSGERRSPINRRGLTIDLGPLEQLLHRIEERWHPYQVWLFGSRARGDASDDADWDLLVVIGDDAPLSEMDPMVGWELQKSSGVRADVFACRLSEFREDLTTPNTLAFDVACEGVLLRER
jgi:uncharacterized protein